MADELIPQIVQSSEEDEAPQPPFKFLAVIQEADKPNKNRRIYPRKVLEQQIERMQDVIKNRGWFGELGVPKDSIIHFAKASHIVTDLFMSDDKMMAEIEVLDTPPGYQLRALLTAGVPVGFRMSGVGNGKVDDYGCLIVDESYKLIQIFACNDPA